jgi:alkyldihydroxyacetonephosphate synthase
VYGPALEDQLRPHGLTLRHFPQSFEFSTLGGGLATRSGGHNATLHTHLDDFVESIRAVTPRGVWESRRLPGSGAGPSPDRVLLGSEGTLGVITEAWMRLQDRPTFRASATARFSTFSAGVEAARAIAQSGLHPANCRLLDPLEAQLTGTDDRGDTLLLLAFESADHPLDAAIGRAVECVLDHGARVDDDSVVVRSEEGSGAREGAAGSWRNAFVRAPYTRDAIVALGVISETFETACTWDRFDALYDAVSTALLDTAEAAGAGPAVMTCRFTHVYPDGPAPYFTVLALGQEGEQLAQWEAMKAAAADALIRAGGTITHHHAVGRDHRRWYDRQRPEPFAAAFQAAKRAVDPAGILNPGVLIDP